MNTVTHILSSSSSAFTSAGVEVFETGPTNFGISFSGADITADYLKFMVDYDNDDDIYTVVTPTTDGAQLNEDIDSIRTQSIEKQFYPGPSYVTSYMINVSGVKKDLSVDCYRINLKLGRQVAEEYKNIQILNSYLYTNKEGSNYLMLTLECDEPRYVGNVVIPYNKDMRWYLPPPIIPFVPNDNTILRLEVMSPQQAYVPIVRERTTAGHIPTEEQYQPHVLGTEGPADDTTLYGELQYNPPRMYEISPFSGMYRETGWNNGRGGLFRDNVHYANKITTGDPLSGTKNPSAVEEIMMWAPEDGIDYSQRDIVGEHSSTYALGALNMYEDDRIINVTITEIWPNGIAP